MKQRLLKWVVCAGAMLVFYVAAACGAVPQRSCGNSHREDLYRLRSDYPLLLPTATEDEIHDALLFSQAVTFTGTIRKDTVRLLSAAVRSLAYAYLAGRPEGKKFHTFMDLLFEQRVIERLPGLVYSSYNDVRRLPADFLSALPACDTDRRQRLIEAVKRFIEFDRLYQDVSTVRENVNTDYLYNVLPHLFVCALHQPDEQLAINDMLAFSHYLSACTQYTPGGKDGLKIDGTGFHHWTHYNGYMYAYKTWVQYMARLKGTAFRIDGDAYQRIAKAVVSEYLMSTLPTSGEAHNFANSLAGRHPFSGLNVDFGRKLFKELVEIGGDVMGEEIDPEMAACYNALFQEEPYRQVGKKKLDGFYQFNYSPVGIYRHDNWVATMRCPTTRFWGAEIYNKTNRFGRYQSHGTLEILYNGPLSQSGYPDGWERAGNSRGGWDWNVIPGTTTVHYTDWKDMMPNGNDADRFDQWSATTNFAGALSWGDCGLFACTFDQGDRWGSQRFTPTGLTFCKSVFAIDGILISLGSGIRAQGDYVADRLTATNLFQVLDEESNGSLVLNGKQLGMKTVLVTDTAKDMWIVTPCSTGYFLPAGNDSLVVSSDVQTTPGPEGTSPESFGTCHVSKAYINHGVKPVGGKYCFAVIPNTTPKGMASLAKLIFRKNGLFEIRCQQDSLHIVRHVPSATLAYALFAPASSVCEGTLYASDTPLLLMERPAGKNTLYMAVCCPDLRPQTVQGSKDWISMPTVANLTLAGHWQVIHNDSDGILACVYEGQYTRVTLELKDGLPLYLELQRDRL